MKILIVDDHLLILDGLSLALGKLFPDCTIVTAENAMQALKAVELEPLFDWLFIDILLPDRSGIELMKEIRQQMIPSPIIMMSGNDDPAMIQHAIQQGANGFLPKHMHSDSLRQCFEKIEEGKLYLPLEIRLLLDEYEIGEGRRKDTINNQLSDKQLQVLILLSQGYSNSEIGTAIVLAESTIKFHVSKIYSILDVGNRTECVAEAHRLGIIDSDNYSTS